MKKKKKSKKMGCFFLIVLLLTSFFAYKHIKYQWQFMKTDSSGARIYLKEIEIPQWIDPQIIHTHTSARSEAPLNRVKNIVIHYVGNPNTSAQNNRDYFDKEDTEVSSHFVVGLNGEIIQCLPLWEKSAASNHRNIDTISIEVCHPDKTGKFNSKTYDSVIKLTAWLCDELKLDNEDVIRHYDVTGKLCPLYYVENEEEWKALKEDVKTRQEDYP